LEERPVRTPVAGPSINVLTGVVGQNQVQMLYGDKAKSSPRSVSYGPTISTGKLNKAGLTLNGDNVTITSTSGMYTAQAGAFRATPKGDIFAKTSISGTPPPTGQAAAQAIDPFEVPSGSANAYDPAVSASVELDPPNVAGGFAAFAVDSSVFTSDSLDNYMDDGSPLNQTLWYLSVGGDTPTTSTNALLVNFQLNPLARNEIQFSSSFLASLGTYTDAASEAVLINQAID
jgi:hypothetical protein